MQIVLEWGSIDKPLTFNISLIQLVFHRIVCSSNTKLCMQRCLQSKYSNICAKFRRGFAL